MINLRQRMGEDDVKIVMSWTGLMADTDYNLMVVADDGDGDGACSGTVGATIATVSGDADGNSANTQLMTSDISLMGDDSVIGSYLLLSNGDEQAACCMIKKQMNGTAGRGPADLKMRIPDQAQADPVTPLMSGGLSSSAEQPEEVDIKMPDSKAEIDRRGERVFKTRGIRGRKLAEEEDFLN